MNQTKPLYLLSLIWLVFSPVSGEFFPEPALTAKLNNGEETAKFSFTLKNTSKIPIKIKKIDVSCTCTELKTNPAPHADGVEIAPDATVDIIANIKIGGRTGNWSEQLVTHLEDADGKEISETLTAKIYVPQLVSIEPATLKWQTGEELTPKKIKVTIQKDSGISIEKIAPKTDLYTYQLIEINEGIEYDIELTPKSTENPKFSIFDILTNSSDPNYEKIRFYGLISRKK